MNAREPVGDSYDSVAGEYYDAARHPTCFNFSELSERFIAPRLTRILRAQADVLDVGAGRSLAAATMERAGYALDRLVLLDRSAAMLSHSRKWLALGARQVVADARETGLGSSSFDVIVASLGDPYNQPAFWREVARLLKPGGICLFTTPAHDWATRFRRDDALELAEFLVAGGTIVNVPSYTPPVPEQIAMIAAAGLEAVDTAAFSRADLSHSASSKLDVVKDERDASVIVGFMVEKPAA